MTDPDARLAELAPIVQSVDVAHLDEASAQAVLGHVRTVQRCLDGLVIRIGQRVTALAEAGHAACARDTLRGDGSVGSRQAAREAARTETVSALEGLEGAIAAGAISGEHIDAITRQRAKLSEEQQAGIDVASLIERASSLPPETFDRLLGREVEELLTDHGLGDVVAKRAASEFRHWWDDHTGMGRFSGALDAERYDLLINAVDHHTTRLASALPEATAKDRNLAAQALVELVTTSSTGRRRPPAIAVIVDHDTIVYGGHPRSIRQTETGHDVPPEAVARLCCDATIRRVTLDPVGVPIDVGRRHRTATDGQWAAIKALHATCAWDGCTLPITWCQAHHIRPWDCGGSTDLDNLVPLCARHHHLVHEGRWRMELSPDRSLTISRPDGTVHATVPPPSRC